jgi:hypothetical protein
MRAWILWQRQVFIWWKRRQSERIAMATAWKMPKWLAYWCAIRVIAHATTGQYGNTDPGMLSTMDALKRWESAA